MSDREGCQQRIKLGVACAQDSRHREVDQVQPIEQVCSKQPCGEAVQPGRITIAGDQNRNIGARRDAEVASEIAPSGITVEWENKTLCAHLT